MMKGLGVRVVIALVVVAIGIHRVRAQPPDAKPLAFDVASIKPNARGNPSQSAGMRPDGFLEVTNTPLRTLIRIAYGVEITGGPRWTETDGYDIVAKVPSGVVLQGPRGPSSQVVAMLRRLLEDRFRLRIRQELAFAPAYGLVFVTYNGRLAPELHVSMTDCTKRDACGIRGGKGDVTYTGVTMSEIAESIEGFAAAPVTNRTALSGRFDLHLLFNEDRGPSLFSALLDQAGLRLQTERYLTEFFKIDHVEKPVPD